MSCLNKWHQKKLLEVLEIELQWGNRTTSVAASKITSILHSGQDGGTQIRNISTLLHHGEENVFNGIIKAWDNISIFRSLMPCSVTSGTELRHVTNVSALCPHEFQTIGEARRQYQHSFQWLKGKKDAPTAVIAVREMMAVEYNQYYVCLMECWSSNHI